MPNASPNQPQLLDNKYQCIPSPSLPLTFFTLKECIPTNCGLYKQISDSDMTGIHIANQCKSVFSKYVWPDTLKSDHDPCYTSQTLTSVIQTFSVFHITSSPHYPQSNGLAGKCVQIVKCFFNKAKEQGKDFYKCLMIYYNTTFIGNLQSPMQILQGRSARSDLPMSNTVRNKLGLKPEVLRNIDKHVKLPTHDLHIGQHVMCQDSTTKWCIQQSLQVYVKRSNDIKSKLVMVSSIKRFKHISSLTHTKTRWHKQWHNQIVIN